MNHPLLNKNVQISPLIYYTGASPIQKTQNKFFHVSYIPSRTIAKNPSLCPHASIWFIDPYWMLAIWEYAKIPSLSPRDFEDTALEKYIDEPPKIEHLGDVRIRALWSHGWASMLEICMTPEILKTYGDATLIKRRYTGVLVFPKNAILIWTNLNRA